MEVCVCVGGSFCIFNFLGLHLSPFQTLICCSSCSLFAVFPLSHSPVIVSCHVWTCRGPQALFFSLSVPSLFLSLLLSPLSGLLFYLPSWQQIEASALTCFAYPARFYRLDLSSVHEQRLSANCPNSLLHEDMEREKKGKRKNNSICVCFYKRLLSVFCPVIFFPL